MDSREKLVHEHHAEGRTPRRDGCHLAAAAGATDTGGRIGWPLHRDLRRRGLVGALVAATGLLTVYLLTLALANSLEHALTEFVRLWPWMTALVGGFAAQVGLFVYVKAATRDADGARAGGVMASGGASTLSMVACCAHHLTDVLPLVGLAGAAVFLTTYQSLFLLVGVLSNVVGLLYVLGLVRRHALYPDRRSVLSLAVAWPVDRAVPHAIIGSGVLLLLAVLRAIP